MGLKKGDFQREKRVSRHPFHEAQCFAAEARLREEMLPCDNTR